RREMERDVAAEAFEERDPISDQDRQDGIIDFVGQPETKAFAGDCTTADEPDVAERRSQTLLYELREIARVELHALPFPRQLPSGEDEGWFVAIRPSLALGFEAQRGLIRPRSHDV